MYDVQTREVLAQDVISVTRSLTVKDLEQFIIDSCRELHAQIERSGAKRDGPWLAIYHGEVNEDSDGPVEMAVPVVGSVELDVDTKRRTEPAHREAYTTITRAQTDFPGILDAYAAVERWIERQGREIADSPREVYFNDDPEPAAESPFCDVAFPYR
jgi:effector-binding domain-containing protein